MQNLFNTQKFTDVYDIYKLFLTIISQKLPANLGPPYADQKELLDIGKGIKII